MANFLTKLRDRLLPSYGGGGYGTFGMWSGLLSGTGVDYRSKAGKVYDNSVVGPSLNWIWKQMLYAPPVVESASVKAGKREWEAVETHDWQSALENAFSPYYAYDTLLHGIVASWWVGGNVYLWPIVSRAGIIVGFQWLPWSTVIPKASDGNAAGTKLVTHYEYTPPGGTPMDLPAEAVIHLRWGIDPANTLLGLSPLMSVLREIAAENGASTLSSALIENGGISGLLFSPKEGKADIDPDQAREIKTQWKRNTTGDMAGTPLMLPFPIDVKEVGARIDNMIPSELRRLHASRICAAIGIDPMVIGFESSSKTYSNYEQAADAAYKGAIAPALMSLGMQLTAAMRRFEGNLNERIRFDEANIPARADDTARLLETAGKAYNDGLVTLNESRAMARYPKTEGGDTFKEATTISPKAMAAKQMRQQAQARVLAGRATEELGDSE